MDNFSSAAQSLPGWAIAVTVVLCLAVIVVAIIAQAKIFKKAGKPGWHAIIPFLNLYQLFDIAWGKGIYFLLTLIPVVGIVVGIIVQLKLAASFGKSTGFGVGLIFLAPIFILILAFGSAQYVGPNGERKLTDAAY